MLDIYQDKHHLPVAVDCIIFGFNQSNLELLLIKRKMEPQVGKWSLMGGFLNQGEALNDAADRVLKDLTGLENIYMEQVSTFGNPDRDPGGQVISVTYVALIRSDEYDQSLIQKHQAQWFPLDQIPELIFDHRDMVLAGLNRLRRKVKVKPVGFNLLPEKFTLPQLQTLYEAILGTELDKRNFRKKFLSLEILEKLDEKEKSTSKKGAYLFKFDQEKFEEKEVDFNF